MHSTDRLSKCTQKCDALIELRRESISPMHETDLDENMIARTDKGILFSIERPYIHVTKDLTGSRTRSIGTDPSAIRTFTRRNKHNRRIRQKISLSIALPFIAIDRHLITCLILQIIVLA